MSDDNRDNANYYKRLAAEMEEADRPQARYQAVLDRHWKARRDEDEPDDQYFVGGFLERHSATPSFHKSRRDGDWRVRSQN